MRLGLCVVALVLSWTHLTIGSRGIKGKRQRRNGGPPVKAERQRGFAGAPREQSRPGLSPGSEAQRIGEAENPWLNKQLETGREEGKPRRLCVPAQPLDETSMEGH
ncbi:hypothetical protein P7K49_015991 [Saguinus oedipus]|uniref:Uncharacterized protein n=1 Tax=Saguinus oedipus TaxID=9490 RepID=A0ABQ9VDN0_SAGOE|nr:hypothetical protein P7K49_015991 [Saguinus oedipus]